MIFPQTAPVLTSAPAPDAHLLVIDDDVRLAELLQRYLQREGYRVSLAVDATEARTLIEYFRFDILILDVRMPGEDGIALTEALRKAGQQTPILLLSAESAVEARVRGLQLGADDYLTKPFDTNELLARIVALRRRVVESRSTTPATVLVLGETRYDVMRQTLTRCQQTQSLSGREQSLLGRLAAEPHQVLSREILHEACGSEGSARMIDTLVMRLRRKLEPDPQHPRYLQTIHGRGYVLRPEKIEHI